MVFRVYILLHQLDKFLVVSRKEIGDSSIELLLLNTDKGGNDSAVEIAPILDKFLGQNAKLNGKKVLELRQLKNHAKRFPHLLKKRLAILHECNVNNKQYKKYIAGEKLWAQDSKIQYK